MIEQMIADLREDANVLRRTGHTHDAATYDRILDNLVATTELEEVLTWLSEEDAMLRSGRGKAWLRSRFAEWERRGHAKMARSTAIIPIGRAITTSAVADTNGM